MSGGNRRTAQFRDELKNTPIAITAVTADMLEQRSQTIIQEGRQAPVSIWW
jgi:hypothetical protein